MCALCSLPSPPSFRGPPLHCCVATLSAEPTVGVCPVLTSSHLPAPKAPQDTYVRSDTHEARHVSACHCLAYAYFLSPPSSKGTTGQHFRLLLKNATLQYPSVSTSVQKSSRDAQGADRVKQTRVPLSWELDRPWVRRFVICTHAHINSQHRTHALKSVALSA